MYYISSFLGFFWHPQATPSFVVGQSGLIFWLTFLYFSKKNPVLQKQKLFYALQYSIDIQYINNLNAKIKHMFAKVSLYTLARPSIFVVRQCLLIFWHTFFILFQKSNTKQNKNLSHILQFLIKIQNWYNLNA